MSDGLGDGLYMAGRFRRFVATLIDAILVPCLTLILVMVAGVVEDAEDYTNSWWMLWVFLLAVLSYLMLNGYALWRRGQTLGKMLAGIVIVPGNGTDDGQYGRAPAPLWTLICVRALFFPLLFLVIIPTFAVLPIIDLLFVFGRRRRCLHDFVARTVVVRLHPR